MKFSVPKMATGVARRTAAMVRATPWPARTARGRTAHKAPMTGTRTSHMMATASPVPDWVKSMMRSTAAMMRQHSATAWSAVRVRSTFTRVEPIPPKPNFAGCP